MQSKKIIISTVLLSLFLSACNKNNGNGNANFPVRPTTPPASTSTAVNAQGVSINLPLHVALTNLETPESVTLQN